MCEVSEKTGTSMLAVNLVENHLLVFSQSVHINSCDYWPFVVTSRRWNFGNVVARWSRST